MKVANLIIKLYKLGIKIQLIDENLDIEANEGVLTEELIGEITKNKKEIISFLKKQQSKNEQLSIINTEKRDYYSLSSAQRRLYVLNQQDKNSTAYNLTSIISLPKDYQKNKIENALIELIKRHDSFRTNFYYLNEEPVQIIHSTVSFQLEVYNCLKNDFYKIYSQFNRPFDLSKDCLLRGAFIEIDGTEKVLLIDMHHIISDNVSASILEKEFISIYNGGKLPPLPLQYKDYSELQKNIIQQARIKNQEAYWLDKFNDEIPVLTLPVDYSREAIQSLEGTSMNLIISGDEAKHIKSFAENQDVTIYMVLLSAFSLFISKISNQNDIVIGTPVAGRQNHNFEDIVGIFINTLALRFKIDSNTTLNEYLNTLKTNTLEAFDNQEYQFEDLIDKVIINRDFSRNPLFDVMFSFVDQTHILDEFSESSEKFNFTTKTSKFDLTLIAVEYENYFLLKFEYSTKLFKQETIERIINYFKHILQQHTNKITSNISDIELITPSQKQQILHDFNKTKKDYPTTKTIHQLIEEQAYRTPSEISVSCNGVVLTYSELNRKAEQLAHYLFQKGYNNGKLVGIMVERSIELVIGILGILKSGCAYLPLDAEHPKERNEKIIKNSEVEVILSNIDGLQLSISEIIDLKNEEIFNRTELKNIIKCKSDDLAYVIYTSGSTGDPKGVMVEHKNVVNFIFGMKEFFDIKEGASLLSLTTISFDIFGLEIYAPLCSGAKVIIGSNEDQKDVKRINQILHENEVSVLQLTPSRLRLILSNTEKPELLSCIKTLLIGGEELPLMLLEEAREVFKGNIYNMYGPTETTIWSTYKNVTGNAQLNIGKPIINTQIRILGQNNSLQPIGISGELCISGDGVARGYYRNPKLTEEKFVEIVDDLGIKTRVYKTGDLARWLPDGDIEFLGRIDQQVKIRGYRVELGEIESILLKHPEVKECVVHIFESNEDKYLCAYIVASKGFDFDSLRSYLIGLLPDYMIPSHFIGVDEIPLTPSGKINRKALPSPQPTRKDDFVKPLTKTQKLLVEIWKEALKLEDVGVKDQFYKVGGDSIKAIRLVNLINKSFNVELQITDLYLNETIEKLSSIISNQNSNRIEEKKTIEKSINELKENILDRIEERQLIEDVYPMSDIEIGMAYHSILDKESGTYLDQMVRQVKIPNFNPQFFEKALNLLCDKHSILRTTLHLEDFQEPVQVVHKKSIVDYQHMDLTGLSGKEQEEYLLQVQKNDKTKGLDIKKLPLWHAKSYSVGNDVIVVLFMCHHAILDGWSDSSLMTELNNVYLKLIEDNSYKPGLLQSTYRNHVVDQIIEKRNEETKEYWIQELKDYKRLEFSKDINIVEEKKIKFVRIDDVLANSIVSLANEFGTNVKNIYFAAYIDIIRRFSYKKDFVVGIVSNTRPVCTDGDKILGCFLNTVPVNITLQPNITNENFLKYIISKLNVLVFYDKLPLAEIQKLVGEDSSDKNPFFDTLFNFIDFHIFNDIEETKAVDYLGIKGNVRINTLFDFSIDRTFSETSLLLLYTNSIITDSRAEEICNCFITTLKRFVSNSEEQLGNDKVFSDEEKNELLYSFNNTENTNSNFNQVSKIINKIFREHSNKTAIVVPVVVEDMHYKYGGSVSKEEIIYDDYTYKYIDQKSNSLVRYLEKKGVRKNSLVGILLEPSVEMIISIVAALKSGFGYMPISSEFPMDRISYMLNDSDAKILISDGLFDLTFNGEVVDVEDEKIYEESTEPIENEVNENDAAYLIYTSGTTGKPKGVLVSQGNLANYVNWFTEKMSITPNDKGILTSSFAFDLGYSSLYTSILSGAELHLPSKDLYLSSSKLIKYIDSNEISYLKLTPSHFNALINSNELRSDNTSNLRLILMGGEPINPIDLKKLFNIKKEIVVVNHYGPTEATIGCITKTIKSDIVEEYSLQPVIGSPIDNAKALILDDDGGILPIGILGELCISGKGVAMGYLNKPELTHSKFIQVDKIDGKVYRTGDKAKWQFNGDIDFLGRVDNQIKIRGYRVELGEIESSLKKSNLVRDAIVIAKQNSNGDKYICAYIIKEKEKVENCCSCNNTSDLRIDYSDLPSIISNKSAENAEEDFIVTSNTSLNFSDVNSKVTSIAHSISSSFDNKYSLNNSERERYKRQILLDSWGLSSQEKLKATVVFVAGAGGGASPTLMQLALAGFGKIKVCDFDEVELSNLNRQFMHDESRLGRNKALSAQETLSKVNPNIEVIPITEKLTRDNVMRLVGDSAIIFDMFDGVQDKFILSECAVRKGIPHVISAMTDINAYSAVFHTPHTPCYHCVFDRDRLYALVNGMKKNDESYKKNPLAVVSSSLFVSAGLGVSEALKIVLGLGVPAYNTFFYYNSKGTDRISEMSTYRSMTYSFSDFFREISKEQGFDWEVGWRGRYLEEIKIKKDPNCPVCGASAKINELVSENDIQSKPATSKSFLTNVINENNCVSICLSDEVAMSLSILAIIKAGKSLCILDPKQLDNDLRNIVITSGTRIIITDNSTLDRAERLRNSVNRNIKIVNIDTIPSDTQANLNQPENKNLSYFYSDNNNEIKSIQLSKLSTWLAEEESSTSKKDLIILKKIYNSLLNNRKLVLDRSLFNSGDISTVLNQELLKHLPEYMLPAMYIEINSIPLTPNGKVNIKALPEPLQVLDEEIEKPQDEKEEIILQVWQEVLGRDIISITDNFFRIGGDSIKAIQISARLNKVGYKLEMADLLRLATIKSVANVIKKSTLVIDQSDVTGDVLLTPIQKEYFKDNFDLHYRNMAVMFHSPNGLSEEEIRAVFNKLVQHHDMLRSTFTNVDGNVIQAIAPVGNSVPLSIYNLKGDKNAADRIEELATQIHASFDLSKAPLIKLGLFKLDDGDRLLISIHHLVMDGISWRILFEDISILLNQYRKNEKLTLPLKTNSFKQWSDKLHEYSSSDALIKEREYWEKLDISVTRPVPEDFKGDNRIKNSNSIIYEFDTDVTSNLLSEANNAFGTEVNDLLLSALSLSIHRLYGYDKVLISLEGHGREGIGVNIDISRTVGWFTTTFPVTLSMESANDLRRQIIVNKDIIHRIPVKGLGYGLLKMISENTNSAYKLTPQISFNYLGQFDEDIKFINDFTLAKESTGITNSPEGLLSFDISFSGMVRNKKLEIILSYNKSKYNHEGMELLLNQFKQELLNIVQFCLSKDNQETTSSDFDYKNLSVEELESIFD
ncbi:MAG: amino acid adenylation domain-containing protein [Bacteroidales bacterium]|nr:amino acid adenylation domain-containing protein [Bacteroidales bacterium]